MQPPKLIKVCNPEQLASVSAMAASGTSPTLIAKWLRERHQVEVSATAVMTFLGLRSARPQRHARVLDRAKQSAEFRASQERYLQLVESFHEFCLQRGIAFQFGVSVAMHEFMRRHAHNGDENFTDTLSEEVRRACT